MAATAPSSPSTASPLSSEARTRVVDHGALELSAGSSSLIDRWGFRVAAGHVFDTFADIRASTDAGPCNAFLDVGESLVLSNRVAGESDYSRWYSVTLTASNDEAASLDWSVGTGAAPITDSITSCT